MEGTIEKVPANNNDVVNKLALDTAIAGVPGGGDVTAAATLTDDKIVQGDTAAKAVKTSTATVTQVAANVTHAAGDGSDHANVATNTTGIATNVTAIGLNTTHRGSDGSDHSKVGANETAIALNTTHRGSNGTDHANVVLNDTHRADNSQAHSDYLVNNAADVGVGLTLSGDNAAADTAYVPMVLFNTDATPPAANTFPRGTIYIQYTA